MDFSSSEELPYQEPTSSPINPEPICFVPLTQLSTEQMLPEPSSSHSTSSSSPNNPETQTNPESYKVMPESDAEDIIQLFPHNISDLVFDITPLTTVPATHTPTFIIPSKPTLPSHPRTTTPTLSSPIKEA